VRLQALGPKELWICGVIGAAPCLAFGTLGRHGRAMDDCTQSLFPAANPVLAHCLSGAVRQDWTRAEIEALFDLPFPDLIFHAQRIHREHFDPREVQISTLLSIKTGGCPEDAPIARRARITPRASRPIN